MLSESFALGQNGIVSDAALHWPPATIRDRQIQHPPGWFLLHGIERVAAAGLLVASAPVLASTGLAIAALSRKSPLVAHRRVGVNGATLWVLKLRTMWQPDSIGGEFGAVEYLTETDVPVIKGGADPRVTSRFAVWLRKYSIDELPQLFHIARGEMSFVGPRPLTQSELANHYGAAAAEVLQIKPGLTGLWQIRGRNRLTYKQRRRLDLFFVRHLSLPLYIRILLKTPRRVLSGADAW